MAYPTGYTEVSMRSYLSVILDAVDAALSISVSRYSEMCNDVLTAYGAADWVDVIDIPKVRALASVVAWKHAMEISSASYNFSADGASYSLSQIQDMCKKNYEAAHSDASAYLNGYEISVSSFEWENDPYAPYVGDL
jgi:hypothetical protein